MVGQSSVVRPVTTDYSFTPSLPGATAHGGEGLEHNLHIQPEGPIIDVEQVVAQLHLSLDRVAAVDLGPAGDPGRHLMPLPVARDLDLVAADEAGPLRARADETHLTAQHVHQLRQLVQTDRAEQLAHRPD